MVLPSEVIKGYSGCIEGIPRGLTWEFSNVGYVGEYPVADLGNESYRDENRINLMIVG